MPGSEVPAVARHRLRLALRRAREAKGFTQRQVASSLEWSMAKVNRIEAGEVAISITDLQALLRYLGIADSSRLHELMDLARDSRQHSWWDQSPYRDHLTPAMVQAIQFQLAATTIRSFHPLLIPGLLQTREYAYAVLANPWSDDFTDDLRTVRLEVRLWKRDQLRTKPEPPEHHVVLDESVLYRELGGPRVVSDQLYDLLDQARAGNVVVKVLPLAPSASFAAFNAFTIYQGGDEEVSLVYRESYGEDEFLLDPDSIRHHQRIFSRLWENSLNPEASANLIEMSAATKRSAADRQEAGA